MLPVGGVVVSGVVVPVAGLSSLVDSGAGAVVVAGLEAGRVAAGADVAGRDVVRGAAGAGARVAATACATSAEAGPAQPRSLRPETVRVALIGKRSPDMLS